MITVTSATDGSSFLINNRKIENIKEVDNNTIRISMENGHAYLVKTSFSELLNKIINFESELIARSNLMSNTIFEGDIYE